MLEQVTEFLRAVQRPYIVFTGWAVFLYLTIVQVIEPAALVGVVAGFTALYFKARDEHHQQQQNPPGA